MKFFRAVILRGARRRVSFSGVRIFFAQKYLVGSYFYWILDTNIFKQKFWLFHQFPLDCPCSHGKLTYDQSKH